MKRKEKRPDYDVGYGKPPKHTRFKPGKSGNPKGRPKVRKNFRALLAEALFKKVTVSDGGQIREISRVEALLTALVAKAIKGDARSLETLLRLMQQHFPGGDEDAGKLAEEPQRVVVQFVDSKGRPKSINNNGCDNQKRPSSPPQPRS